MNSKKTFKFLTNISSNFEEEKRSKKRERIRNKCIKIRQEFNLEMRSENR